MDCIKMTACVSVLVLVLFAKPVVPSHLSATAAPVNSPILTPAAGVASSTIPNHKTDLKLLLDITNIYVSVKVNRYFRAMNQSRRQLLRSVITKLVKLTEQQTAVQNLLDDEAENATLATVAMKKLLDKTLNKSFEWVKSEFGITLNEYSLKQISASLLISSEARYLSRVVANGDNSITIENSCKQVLTHALSIENKSLMCHIVFVVSPYCYVKYAEKQCS